MFTIEKKKKKKKNASYKAPNMCLGEFLNEPGINYPFFPLDQFSQNQVSHTFLHYQLSTQLGAPLYAGVTSPL